MNQIKFKEFMMAQQKEIEVWKWNKGLELCRDPGPEAVEEWIKKYAKIFRKKFAINDLRQALAELTTIRSEIDAYFQRITSIVNEVNRLTKIVNECESKLLEGVELLESEPDQS